MEEAAVRMTSDPLYTSVSKITDPVEIAEKHFLDSLAPLTLQLPCWKAGQTVLDLGTGGGFPAVPLACYFEDMTVVAVDAKRKAVDFLHRLKSGGFLPNLKPMLGRGEEIGRAGEFRGRMDLVVCRAVAEIRILIELTLPLARTDGFVMLYKGPKVETELSESKTALKKLGVQSEDMTLRKLCPPQLPFTRGYVLIHKRRGSPDAYPRRNGVPASDPL